VESSGDPSGRLDPEAPKRGGGASGAAASVCRKRWSRLASGSQLESHRIVSTAYPSMVQKTAASRMLMLTSLRSVQMALSDPSLSRKTRYRRMVVPFDERLHLVTISSGASLSRNRLRSSMCTRRSRWEVHALYFKGSDARCSASAAELGASTAWDLSIASAEEERPIGTARLTIELCCRCLFGVLWCTARVWECYEAAETRRLLPRRAGQEGSWASLGTSRAPLGPSAAGHKPRG